MTQSTPDEPEKAKAPERWHMGEEMMLVIFLSLAVLTFIVLSFQYPPKARFVPLFILVPLLIGLGVQLGFLILKSPPQKKSGQGRATMTSLLWVLALIALMYLGGMLMGLALFVIVYTRVYCREGWRTSILTTVVVTAGVYAFLSNLKLPVYWGVVVEAFGP